MNIEGDTLIIGADCVLIGHRAEIIDLTNVKHIIFEPRTTPCKILHNAFYKLEKLETIYISKWVTFIGNCAFANCSNLTEIFFEERPNGLQLIFGDSAFKCTSIKSVKFPFGVLVITNHLFYMCHSLCEVIISRSIILIDELSFCDCTNLTTIIYENRTCDTKLIIGRGAFSLSGIKILYIPQFVTKIYNNAFRFLNKLTHVYFEYLYNNNLSIGNDVFSGCNNLIYVEMPRGINYIGYDNFIGCYKLKYIITLTQLYESFRGLTFVRIFGVPIQNNFHCIKYYGTNHNYIRRKKFLNYAGIIRHIIKIKQASQIFPMKSRAIKLSAMELILRTPRFWRQICTNL